VALPVRVALKLNAALKHGARDEENRKSRDVVMLPNTLPAERERRLKNAK
jgi:hypothetical protein